ncbi:MAG: phosphoribosyltransferase [Acidimicrobiia bacterium]
MTTDGHPHESFTWAEFGDATRELAEHVAASGFQPDLVLAIARGGLPVAGAVAYALDVKNCFCVNVEYYTGVDERLDLPVLLAPALDPADLAGARVLVCDDVNDTGNTLRLVMETCQPQVARIRSLVLYEKPRSSIQADFVWRRTDRWIDFPWSAPGPVAGTTKSASASLS